MSPSSQQSEQDQTLSRAADPYIRAMLEIVLSHLGAATAYLCALYDDWLKEVQELVKLLSHRKAHLQDQLSQILAPPPAPADLSQFSQFLHPQPLCHSTSKPNIRLPDFLVKEQPAHTGSSATPEGQYGLAPLLQRKAISVAAGSQPVLLFSQPFNLGGSFESANILPRANRASEVDLEYLPDNVSIKVAGWSKAPNPNMNQNPESSIPANPAANTKGKLRVIVLKSDDDNEEDNYYEVPPFVIKQEPGVPRAQQSESAVPVVDLEHETSEDDFVHQATRKTSHLPVCKQMIIDDNDEEDEVVGKTRGRMNEQQDHPRVAGDTSSGARSSDSNKRTRMLTPTRKEAKLQEDDELFVAQPNDAKYWAHIGSVLQRVMCEPSVASESATACATLHTSSAATKVGRSVPHVLDHFSDAAPPRPAPVPATCQCTARKKKKP
ncbi:hypothetical protein BDV93DRAFT_561314 [Ceratobasidium sp. AG-I]|nr:hypothetical protein BDV93DRAFT_561314 [Ceratobasidium sp. AG-I]